MQFETCKIMQTYKKRNVDVRVVSMIDMSTFLKIFFVHVFPHELNILQWSISNNYKKWEALIIASHGCCIEAKFGWISFACFQINQSTFYSNKRESIFPILMCHSLLFRIFCSLDTFTLIHLHVMQEESSKDFAIHCKWERKRKFWMEEWMCVMSQQFFVAK